MLVPVLALPLTQHVAVAKPLSLCWLQFPSHVRWGLAQCGWLPGVPRWPCGVRGCWAAGLKPLCLHRRQLAFTLRSVFHVKCAVLQADV